MIYAYIRVSGQSSYDDGLSIAEQKASILKYCNQNSMTEPTWILETKAMSGGRSDRPGLNKLKDLISKGKASVVLLYDLSRLSRDLADSANFLKDFVKRKKVRLIVVNEMMDVSTTMGKQNFQMKAMMNEWYRDAVSQKMTQIKQHMKDNKMFTGGIVPYGFDVNEGKLIDNKSEQQVIEHIYRLKLKGWTYSRISKNLRTLKVTTKTGKKHWSPKVLRSLYLTYSYDI